MAGKPQFVPKPQEPGEVFVSPSPGSPPDRVVRVGGSVATIETIVNDQRSNWSDFLSEDHGDHGKETKATIESLFKIYPE